MSLKDAIREAVDERDKRVIEPKENRDAVNTASSKTVNTASKDAVFTAKSKAVNTAKDKAASKTASPKKSRGVAGVSALGAIPIEETAAMTVRVSRRHRLHWLISAKQQGTSLTAAITEALNARFGEPGD